MQKNTDTVPAMLTPGEFVIRRDAAEQIGPEKLQMLNNIDRLSNSALIENAKSPVGYQEGGEVGFKELADLAKLYGEKQGITLNLADYTPEGGRSKEGYARKFNLPEGFTIDTLAYGSPANYSLKFLDAEGQKLGTSKSTGMYPILQDIINAKMVSGFEDKVSMDNMSEYLKKKQEDRKFESMFNTLIENAEKNYPKEKQKFQEGGEVKIASDLYMRDDDSSSDAIFNLFSQNQDDPSDFLRQAIREYQRGDSSAGSEDVYSGSGEYQRDVYSPRFEVTEYGDGNERTVESKEQVNLGSLPILKKIAEKAAEKGLNPESVIGKVLNLGLPLTRERKGGESKIRLGYNEGGEVMDNNEFMSVFGEKSQDADGLRALAALIRIQQMQQAPQDATRTMGLDNLIPNNVGRMDPETLEFLKRQKEPIGMMGGGYAKPMGMYGGGYVKKYGQGGPVRYQQGGPVEPPMTGGEPMMLEEPPMPMGEQAYYESPANQLGLDQYEHMAYMKHGPDSFRFMAPKYKPRQQWSAYDALVDTGLVNPYEVDRDEVNVVTNDQMEELSKSAMRQ